MSISTEIKKIRFTGDYNMQLAEFIDDYFKELCEERIDIRLMTVDSLIEKFIDDTDERPDSYALNRLGHALAWDYMEGDVHPDKMTREEYPIMTERQERWRKTGHRQSRNAQGVTHYEVPLTNAETIGTDGVDYRPPIRQYR